MMSLSYEKINKLERFRIEINILRLEAKKGGLKTLTGIEYIKQPGSDFIFNPSLFRLPDILKKQNPLSRPQIKISIPLP